MKEERKNTNLDSATAFPNLYTSKTHFLFFKKGFVFSSFFPGKGEMTSWISHMTGAIKIHPWEKESRKTGFSFISFKLIVASPSSPFLPPAPPPPNYNPNRGGRNMRWSHLIGRVSGPTSFNSGWVMSGFLFCLICLISLSFNQPVIGFPTFFIPSVFLSRSAARER